MTAEQAIDRSYQLLALLEICAHNARYLHDLHPDHVKRAGGNPTNVIELAGHIAEELHDVLERGYDCERSS